MKPQVFHHITIYSVLMFILVMSFMPINAQHILYDKIMCSSISIVNDDGKVCALLSSTKDGGVLSLFSVVNETSRVKIMVAPNDIGTFHMLGPNQKELCSFIALDHGSLFTVFSPNQESEVGTIASSKLGGSIRLTRGSQEKYIFPDP